MKRFIRLSIFVIAANFVIFGAALAKLEPSIARLPASELNCDEAGGTGKAASTSPNLQYFKKLYARAQAAENIGLSEFLRLWFPVHGDGSKLGSPFFACEDRPMGGFVQADLAKPDVPVNCRPDILYSWGPVSKMDILANLADGQSWQGPLNAGGQIEKGMEFGSISPIATFGYGDILFRFKIKKTAAYRFESFGTQAGEVGVRTGTYHDFAVSDASIVESVSTGTPEIYDEVVRDLLRFRSGKRVSAYNVESGVGLDRLFSQMVDGNDQSELHLQTNLVRMIGQILEGQGALQYSAGVCRSRQLTFSTTYPAYFEPIASPKY